MNSVHKTNALRISGHHDRVRSFAGTEESYTSEQSSVCNTRSGENYFLSRSEVVCIVYLIWIGDAHFVESSPNLVLRRNFIAVDAKPFGIVNKFRLYLTVKALHRGGGDHTFWSASDTHQGMDICTGYR